MYTKSTSMEFVRKASKLAIAVFAGIVTNRNRNQRIQSRMQRARKPISDLGFYTEQDCPN